MKLSSPNRELVGRKSDASGLLCLALQESTSERARHPTNISASQSAAAKQSLLRLQRQHGNRYVQRAITLVNTADTGSKIPSEVEKAILQLRDGGQLLDGRLRAPMESFFGADLSDVHLHTDTNADLLSRKLDARAFTVGRDIFFRQAEYAPHTSTGRELLAHEVAHVLQQDGGNTQSELTLASPQDRYECEAEIAAMQFIHQEQLSATSKSASSPVVGRPPHALEVSAISLHRKGTLAATQSHPSPKQIELVFIPDDKEQDDGPMGVIHVRVKGVEQATYDARGGPWLKCIDPQQLPKDIRYRPTQSGNYVLGAPSKYQAPGGLWRFSQIPWGTELRVPEGEGRTDLEYKKGQKWLSTMALPKPLTRDDIGWAEVICAAKIAVAAGLIKPSELEYDEQDQPKVRRRGIEYFIDVAGQSPISASIPSRWNLNDFGPVAFQLFKPKTMKRKIQEGTKLFLHTTPVNEAQFTLALTQSLLPMWFPAIYQETLKFSHGCIHIKPSDRQEMMAKGYLQAGVMLTVKAYRLTEYERWEKWRLPEVCIP